MLVFTLFSICTSVCAPLCSQIRVSVHLGACTLVCVGFAVSTLVYAHLWSVYMGALSILQIASFVWKVHACTYVYVWPVLGCLCMRVSISGIENSECVHLCMHTSVCALLCNLFAATAAVACVCVLSQQCKCPPQCGCICGHPSLLLDRVCVCMCVCVWLTVVCLNV